MNLGDPRTWNKYTYVGGDPVNYNDPSGAMMAVVCGFQDCGGGSFGPLIGPFDWYFGAGNSGSEPYLGPLGPRPGGGGGGVSEGPRTAPSSGNAERDKIRNRIYQFSTTLFGPEVLDCISGIESSWNPNARNGSFRGLYQINKTTWYDSGTLADYDKFINDVDISSAVALTELYRKLEYTVGGIKNFVAAGGNFTRVQLQQAISAFGEGNDLYGKDVMDCADAMKRGDYAAGQGFIDDYHRNRP